MFIGKSIIRATRLLLVVLMTALVPGLLLGATDGPKRILLLDSYGRNVAPVSTIISSFRRELSSRSPQPIDLHEVSLEMARDVVLFKGKQEDRPDRGDETGVAGDG